MDLGTPKQWLVIALAGLGIAVAAALLAGTSDDGGVRVGGVITLAALALAGVTAARGRR